MVVSTTLICFVICISYLQSVNSQTCSNSLNNPPELIWTANPISSNTFSATLTFDISTKTWNNNSISLTTRLYNNLLGGPTVRMQRGKRYELTLLNNLGPERIQNSALSGNQERDPNTTNLHTHGVHISPLSPGDHIFVPIAPGGNDTYIYNIPCSHSGGIHWYHAHHHPSVQLHIAGGAAGAIIIEDNAQQEGLPDWYTNMRELIFFINHIDATFINIGYPPRTQAQKDNQIVLKLNTPNNNDLYIVNGKYQPNVCQTVGEWIRYRFIQTEVRDPQRYQIGTDGDCILKLLSRDGVIVNNPPRDVDNIVWLAEASRADVAITCIAGIHAITALNHNGNNIVIAFIHVTNAVDQNNDVIPIQLTPFQPIRPSYLTDLRANNIVVDNSLSLEIMHNAIAINGERQVFGQHANPYFSGVNNIAINSVNEWTLLPQDLGADFWHPFHIHINHFQIVSAPNRGPISFQSHLVPPSQYQQVGDFIDTLWGPGVIRFRADIFAGPLLVHCHRLEHEVSGAMGSMKIENGCDVFFNDYNNQTGTCTFNSDCSPTKQPTLNPSMQPSITPTLSPTQSTFTPSLSPTQEPTYIPTDLPSEQPTTDPTVKPSISPSNIPTNNPSNIPTNPSKTPTTYPTFTPTNIPTVQPTIYPTFIPSNTPTNMPSLYPTVDPSNKPTITPTVYPTHDPTIQPTIDPTNEPTIVPTLHPSIDPTIEPTNNPTQWLPIPSTTLLLVDGWKSNKSNDFEFVIKHHVIIISVLSACLIFFIICNGTIYCKKKFKNRPLSMRGYHHHMRIKTDVSELFSSIPNDVSHVEPNDTPMHIPIEAPMDTHNINDYDNVDTETISIVKGINSYSLPPQIKI